MKGLSNLRKMMPMRLWAVILIYCFAFAQTAVAAHNAAYSSDLHYHDGALCAISLHGDRHDHMDVPPAVAVILSCKALFIFRPANATAPQHAAGFARRARAPPHHSTTA